MAAASEAAGQQARDECVAELAGVHHRYGDVVALDGLDLAVRAGDVLAVLGPNGAGKTTAISLLLGSLSVQRGEVRVFGAEPGAEAVRLRRGAMLQASGVPNTLTVIEHLELFCSYYPTPLPVPRLLAMAGLEDVGARRFQRLSGGQKQRVMFALALAGDPELVFLDEPTTGLDVEARRSLWREIRALKAAGRTAVLTPTTWRRPTPSRTASRFWIAGASSPRGHRPRSSRAPRIGGSVASPERPRTKWPPSAWRGWSGTAGTWRSSPRAPRRFCGRCWRAIPTCTICR